MQEVLELRHGADSVIMVDVARSSADAGTIRRFDAAEPLSTDVGTFAIGDAIELVRALQPAAAAYGLRHRGGGFGPGPGLSPAVARAARRSPAPCAVPAARSTALTP